MWETPLVTAKTKAAKLKFKSMNLEYELVDPGKIDEKRFKNLVDSGVVKLTEKYKKKFEEYKWKF